MAAWGNNYTIAGMPFVNIRVSYGSLPNLITELVPFTDTNTHSNPNLDHSQYNCELRYFLAVQKSKETFWGKRLLGLISIPRRKSES